MCDLASFPARRTPHRVFDWGKALGKPRPFFAVFDEVDRGSVNPEFARNVSLWARVKKCVQNLFFGQHGRSVALAIQLEARMPALSHCVCLVIAARAAKKVLGIYAGRCVAGVANLHAAPDVANVRSVEISRRDDFARPFWDGAVSGAINRARPNPAPSIANLVSQKMVQAFPHAVNFAQCGSHLNRLGV